MITYHLTESALEMDNKKPSKGKKSKDVKKKPLENKKKNDTDKRPSDMSNKKKKFERILSEARRKKEDPNKKPQDITKEKELEELLNKLREVKRKRDKKENPPTLEKKKPAQNQKFKDNVNKRKFMKNMISEPLERKDQKAHGDGKTNMEKNDKISSNEENLVEDILSGEDDEDNVSEVVIEDEFSDSDGNQGKFESRAAPA